MKTKKANGEGSVYRRSDNRKFVAQVTLGRNPATGKIIRKTKTVNTKIEGYQWIRTTKAKHVGVSYYTDDKLTIGAWSLQWLSIYKKDIVRYIQKRYC